jgi:hypothetical protein
LFFSLSEESKFAAILYKQRIVQHDDSAAGRNYYAVGKSTCRNETKRNKIMGDRSPKSNQKKSSQKQAKASSASQKRAQASAAKQAAGKKK